jgi:UDP-N-acetylmuramoyl-tripeptide--D-alanyl-D-alanine ligase
MMTFLRTQITAMRHGGWRTRAIKLAAMVWRRLLFRTTVIAITGSVGKTTAKEILTAVLSSHGRTMATVATSNTALNVSQTILRTRPWHRFLVLEVGTDSPGWIRRSALIARPDIAVILNVGRTHIIHFPAIEDTAREKGALLSGLTRNGVAILNQDDSHVAAMASGRRGRVVWFGSRDSAHVRAVGATATWPERLSVSLHTRDACEKINTQFVGRHWITSLLGAAAAALECGVSLQRFAAIVADVKPTPGRLDPQVLPSGAIILRDDYNGALQTFACSFQVLREARAERKILAITTVTDSTERWRYRLRRIVREAAGVADEVLLVGHKDDTKRAVTAAVAAGFSRDQLHCFERLLDAAEFLPGFLRAGDLLLLRGRAGDHVARVYHAQLRHVSCWIDHCSETILCDHCPALFASPNCGDRSPIVEQIAAARCK